jgi:CheY-like chemotaxis protein
MIIEREARHDHRSMKLAVLERRARSCCVAVRQSRRRMLWASRSGVSHRAAMNGSPPAVVNGPDVTEVTRGQLEGLTVLVVDDERDTVDVVVVFLEALGATVVGCSTARAGLDITARHAFDAILVDLRMPGQDGWRFLRELRAVATGVTTDVPVFAVSDDSRQEPNALAAGFAAFFLKPVDLDALVANLATLTSRPLKAD